MQNPPLFYQTRIRDLPIESPKHLEANISRDSDVTRQAVPPGIVIFPDRASEPQPGKITVLQVVHSRFDIEKAE